MSLVKAIRKHPLSAASIIILPALFLLILSFYLNRLGAFGCFDDCFNFVRGFFVLQDKKLYSEVFSNHMPFIAYISAIIQKLTSPGDIYQLLLFHKLFLLTVSFFSWIILIFRFRWAGLFFVLFYEPFKLYLFGDRFLAEGIIIYPIVYLAGLVFTKFKNKTIHKWEYIFSAVLAWFVLFMREPYIPLTLFLFGLILWNKKELKIKVQSFLLFLFLIFAFLLTQPINDFILNTFTLNKSRAVSELSQQGLLDTGFFKIFFYPILVFFTGEQNIMRFILVSLNLVFVVAFVRLIMRGEKLPAFIIFLVLGLANIRYVEPGTMFYTSYHMLIWFGLLVMFTGLMFVYSKDKVLKKILTIFLGASFVVAFISPQNVLWERVNTVREVNDGYANDTIHGLVIKNLARDGSTLFVDGGDDLIYFVAEVDSSYRYSWYTSLMPYYKPFADEREKMFTSNPPDFYFGNCRNGYYLPDNVKGKYVNLKNNGRKSCLYIKNELIKKIPESSWDKAKSLGYGLE